MVSYAILESRQARRILLRADPRHGLVVVVPAGYDRRLIAGVLQKHAAWIEQAVRPHESQNLSSVLPIEVALAAGGQIVPVSYRATASAWVTARETAAGLQLSGRVGDGEACRRALRRWLCRRGRRDLIPRLASLSAETGLEYSGSSIRLQRSRWGSCSPRSAISLNAALLFLPPYLVRYVLLHELCHTRHLDHSHRFWKLLARHEPLHEQSRRELASWHTSLPGWVHERPHPTEIGYVELCYA